MDAATRSFIKERRDAIIRERWRNGSPGPTKIGEAVVRALDAREWRSAAQVGAAIGVSGRTASQALRYRAAASEIEMKTRAGQGALYRRVRIPPANATTHANSLVKCEKISRQREERF